MTRRFHSYGPIDPKLHFCVPRLALVEQCVSQLTGASEQGHYFTIWAARQSGKTWLMRQALTQIRSRFGDRFVVGALSMQGVKLPEGPADGAFFSLLPRLLKKSLHMEVPPLQSWQDFSALFEVGGLFSKERPLILFIDEFDRLPPEIIDSLVTQFRDLYLSPETSTLHGLALLGVRAVLGVESDRGSPFNVQRSLHVPNLTQDEVTEMFAQYQRESGQPIDKAVVDKLFEVTRGQPGLVSWLGELLTEKYNHDQTHPLTLSHFARTYEAACKIEPNNTVLNLLKKAQSPAYRDHVVSLFRKSNVPFSFDQDWCNYLYTHGVIDQEMITTENGDLTTVCRFSSPFVQSRLYSAFSNTMADLAEHTEGGKRVPPLDPRDDLTEVIAALDLPALLGRYRDYLSRLRQRGINPWVGQPRRSDLHLTEAVGHFHLYWWLVEAVGRTCTVSPEFPTGNGKVDLHLRHRDQVGLIEVKSFTTRADLPSQREQAARYAASHNLPRATLAVFVPSEDESLMDELSSHSQILVNGHPVLITTVAISAL